MRIYHNPRCSKSRQTLELIRDAGVEPEIVEYLKAPPTADELDAILTHLGLPPVEIVRRKESRFQELELAEKSLNREEWIALLVQNPQLIERPIVVEGDRAVIGRPPENVLPLIESSRT